MLSLHNIGKTYVTKAKAKTYALKDINLDIVGKGMVVILGKSGSGKSTLLNLLGGLDSPTSGEIFVDGVNMKQFTKRDYDAYRNNYVGFIFQEFNLLSDFNVRDNIALALKLAKDDNVDAKVSAALQQVELNDEYLTRRVDEMSGGEKQRVAIARALIKDSKMILADEPTGNLDSATGESIWNLLKALSAERLVVVVTHDRESAEKYSDRIIEIADGGVVSDNGTQPEVEQDAQSKPASSRSRLSFATRIKMGYNNLRLRKAKTVSVILLAVFSILSILITQMCLSFSAELTLAKYITQYNIDYFTVSQGHVSGYNNTFETTGDTPLKNSMLNYVADNSKYIKNGIVKSKRDILNFGLSFVGEALELDDNSYYATDVGIERCYELGAGLVEIDGQYVSIVKEYHPIEFLVGKKVYLDKDFDDSVECVLAGVIHTDNLVNASALPLYFYNSNFAGIFVNHQHTFNHTDPKDVTLRLSDKVYDGKFEITTYIGGFLLEEYSVIVTADGLRTKIENVSVEDNDVILPYELYAEIFEANSKWYYVNTNLTEMLKMPQSIGQKFDLKLYEYGTGELIADYGEVRLAGVAFTKSGRESFIENQIGVSEKLCRRILADVKSPKILVQSKSVNNISSFVTTLRNDYQGYVENAGCVKATSHTGQSEQNVYLADMAYEFEQIIKLLSIVFLAIAVILLIVLVLLVINLISFSIASRKKEVGILSALGSSNRDITSIFLLETLIISAISFVILLALTFIFEWVFNSILSGAYLLNMVFPFLRVDVVTIAVLVGAAFGLLLLAALIPIRKIIKLKPIDAIRNN